MYVLIFDHGCKGGRNSAERYLRIHAHNHHLAYADTPKAIIRSLEQGVPPIKGSLANHTWYDVSKSMGVEYYVVQIAPRGIKVAHIRPLGPRVTEAGLQLEIR